MTPADTNLGELILWVAAISTLLNFGAVVWSIFSGPARRNSERLDRHGARLDAHEMRIGAIEQHQNALPSQKDLHELQLAMVRLQGELATMVKAMEGHNEIYMRLEAIVARHDEYLRKPSL